MRLMVSRLNANKFKDIFVTGSIVFGDGKTEGDWRTIRNGNNLDDQRYESSTWKKKSASIP